MIDEKWLVRGRDPVLWTVPFYVHWIDGGTGDIYYAIPLRSNQEDAVRRLMNQVAKPFQGMWRISRPDLEQIATKLPDSTDPENVFSWERPRIAQAPEFHPEKRKERDEFLDALYQKGVGKSRDEIEFWWQIFCKHAFDWLTNSGKPVDLYFCKLHNSPLRHNWRQIVLSRLPYLGRTICSTTQAERKFHVERSGLLDELVSLDMLALHKKEAYCLRHVEVEHSALWWKTVKRVELTRRKKLGVCGYFDYFTGMVRRFRDVAYRLYMEHLHCIARPTACAVQSGPDGEYRLAPNWETFHLRRSGIQTSHVPAVVINRHPVWVAASPADRLCEANIGVSPMPAVQPPPPDLWNSRRDLPEPGDQTQGTPGVLVPNAGQSSAAGELLAVRPDNGSEGVDI